MRHAAHYASGGPSDFRRARYEPSSSFEQYYPDERIGASLEDGRRISLPWLGILTVITLCSGLVLFETGGRWSNAFEEPTPPPVTADTSEVTVPAAPEDAPVGGPDAATAPEAFVSSPDRAPDDRDMPVPEDKADTAAPPHLINPSAPAELPPIATPTDPLRKRALAAGLHPSLSLALLQRLSAVDFRNAKVAISTALKKGAAPKAHVWPAKIAKGRAQFRVRFVPSVSPLCLRYVTEIIVNRWVTTALPMEKCADTHNGKPAKT